jgi:hypothetical protein
MWQFGCDLFTAGYDEQITFRVVPDVPVGVLGITPCFHDMATNGPVHPELPTMEVTQEG